jgi:hypothetical protein
MFKHRMKVIGVNIILFLVAIALVGIVYGLGALLILAVPKLVMQVLIGVFFIGILLFAAAFYTWKFIKWIAIEPYRDYKAKKGA